MSKPRPIANGDASNVPAFGIVWPSPTHQPLSLPRELTQLRQLSAVPALNEVSCSSTQMIWIFSARNISSTCATEPACVRQAGHHAGAETKSMCPNVDQAMFGSLSQCTASSESGKLSPAKLIASGQLYGNST